MEGDFTRHSERERKYRLDENESIRRSRAIRGGRIVDRL